MTTLPPPLSLLMSGEADRLWLQAQVNNVKKKKRIHSGKVGHFLLEICTQTHIHLHS